MRLAVVSASSVVRAGLSALLTSADEAASGRTGWRVVAEFANLEVALQRLPARYPDANWDAIIVDARHESLDDLIELADRSDDAALVLLGPASPEAPLIEALQGRAWAYTRVDADLTTLIAAIEAARAGLVAIEPAYLERWRDRTNARPEGPDEPPAEPLTPREREVLDLIAQGLPNKTIAQRLGVTEHTVKFHVGAILGKLGAASRAEAVHLGARRGWLTW